MNRRAVLDACVLVPYNLASLLLTLTDRDLLEPRWSGTIPEETDRALTTKIGLDKERARRRLTLTAMQHAFPEAEVVGFEVLIEGLGCHPKDRHVLAAAFASDADVILTFNLSDFPDNACEPHGVVAVHPEQYLLELLATDREATLQAIVEDASRRTSPPLSPSEFLARLAATVPTFANMAHQASRRTVRSVGSPPTSSLTQPTLPWPLWLRAVTSPTRSKWRRSGGSHCFTATSTRNS
ncbi:MAG: PIN domain-containing protein [Dermatophilaceae bacterium]